MTIYEQLKIKNAYNKSLPHKLTIVDVLSYKKGYFRVKGDNQRYIITGEQLYTIIMNKKFYITNISRCVSCPDKAFKRFVPTMTVRGYNKETGHIDIDNFKLDINTIDGTTSYDFYDFCDYIESFYEEPEIWQESSTSDKCCTILSILESVHSPADIDNIAEITARFCQ